MALIGNKVLYNREIFWLFVCMYVCPSLWVSVRAKKFSFKNIFEQCKGTADHLVPSSNLLFLVVRVLVCLFWFLLYLIAVPVLASVNTLTVVLES